MVRVFKDLLAWQAAHELVITVYRFTDCLPGSETFGLRSQMRRAAVSVTSNIAEGFGRTGMNDKLRFYIMARGSVFELNAQIEVCKSLQLVSLGKYEELLDYIDSSTRLLQGLIRATENKSDRTDTLNPNSYIQHPH